MKTFSNDWMLVKLSVAELNEIRRAIRNGTLGLGRKSPHDGDFRSMPLLDKLLGDYEAAESTLATLKEGLRAREFTTGVMRSDFCPICFDGRPTLIFNR